MLERLVKPILVAWDELKIADNKTLELSNKICVLRKEYEEQMKPLEKELEINKNNASKLRDKQLVLRKKLGYQLREAKCQMTTVNIEMNGETKLYGVYENSGMIMLAEITNTKEAEKLLAVEKLEKSK